MADEIKRVQVRIGSMSYSLVSAEDEQYTRKVGARADEMIKRVMQNNPQLSQHQATVLALVNAIDDLTRMYDKVKSEDNRQHEIDRQISEVRHELQRQREQNWDMKKETLELRQVCRAYEAELARWRRGGSTRPEANDDLGPLQVSDVAWQENDQKQTEDTRTDRDQSLPDRSEAERQQQGQVSPEALEAADPERKQEHHQPAGQAEEANETMPDTDDIDNKIDESPEVSLESGSLKQTHFDDYLNQDSKDGH